MSADQEGTKDVAELLSEVAMEVRTLAESTTPAPAWDKTTLLTFGLSTLVFGIITLVAVTHLLAKQTPTNAILRSVTIPMLITASVFVITAGWSKEQIAPVIGLFGTIAGYILGKSDSSDAPPLPASSSGSPPDGAGAASDGVSGETPPQTPGEPSASTPDSPDPEEESHRG